MFTTRRTTTLFFFLVLSFTSLKGQEQIKSKNSLSVALLSHGFIYSIGYERIVHINAKTSLSLKGEAAYYPRNSGIALMWLPFTINHLLTTKYQRLVLEYGIGRLVHYDFRLGPYSSKPNLMFGGTIFNAGARIAFKKSNSLNISYSPFFRENEYINWATISYRRYF